jgi:putative addiction module component (TIGR02574 family)
MNTEEFISTIKDLPVKERIRIADEIARSLNPPDPEVERAWINEVKRRAQQVENGEAEMIPGEQVKREMEERFYK